ncbi:MAG: UbiX family flavin prenyltransferase [Candidatus Thermoplasmatota archaeon]|nr:UbiX family flavin prenyltransferase [Candidatus Thermoplasmatota archaeon]
MDIVVAMTGASGAGYALALLGELEGEESIKVTLIVNSTALSIASRECGVGPQVLRRMVSEMVDAEEMDHPLASGSNRFDALVVCPCTTSTASKIASGIADNLATRAAAVALKERRRLVLVVRETPLSTPVLKNLHELSTWGAVILPASPPFYSGPSSIDDIYRSIAGRVLDIIGIENELVPRYVPLRTEG